MHINTTPDHDMLNLPTLTAVNKSCFTVMVLSNLAFFESTFTGCFSLNNLSDEIRWSLDLRWQRSDMAVGFYGLKDGIKMRSSNDPDFKIDWESFDNINRHQEVLKAEGKVMNCKALAMNVERF